MVAEFDRSGAGNSACISFRCHKNMGHFGIISLEILVVFAFKTQKNYLKLWHCMDCRMRFAPIRMDSPRVPTPYSEPLENLCRVTAPDIVESIGKILPKLMI
jgi:hypothetical protein